MRLNVDARGKLDIQVTAGPRGVWVRGLPEGNLDPEEASTLGMALLRAADAASFAMARRDPAE